MQMWCILILLTLYHSIIIFRFEQIKNNFYSNHLLPKFLECQKQYKSAVLKNLFLKLLGALVNSQEKPHSRSD
jgi:hypothetical protein